MGYPLLTDKVKSMLSGYSPDYIPYIGAYIGT